MKRLALSLFYLMLFSVSFGQFVEMTSVVPTEPKIVVDTLTVFDTGSTNPSSINHLNLGFFSTSTASNVNRPFQIPKLTADILNVGNLNAGRDISIITSDTQTANTVSLKGGILFVPEVTSIGSINTNSNPYAVFRANQVNIEDDGSLSLNRLEGKNITVSNLSIYQPVSKGNLISVRNQRFYYYEQMDPKYIHIYRPWSSPEPSGNISSYSSLSPLCSNAGNLASTLQAPCTEDACHCNENDSGYCYEFRKLKLPAVYDAQGATYEKIGTVKFYCKPNTCTQYMIYTAREGTITEGFTASISNPFPNISTNINLVKSSSSTPAIKCNILCNNNAGCTAAQTVFIAIDQSDGSIDDFSTTFQSASFCNSAATGYPQGSGLNCKANEKVFDIYALKCNVGSGKRVRQEGEFFQRRQVICQQFDQVKDETDTSSNPELVKRGMFISVDY